MTRLRAFLLDRKRLALLLVALALAMKALVPGGFMLGAQSQVLTVSICADSSGTHLTREIVVPREGGEKDTVSQHAKGAPCAFSALGMDGLVGADPILLALALAFILAIGLAPLAAPTFEARTHLRPPLRGPPLTA
jgi:hypothetical protein